MNIEIKKIKLSGVTITTETEEEKKKVNIIIPEFLRNQKKNVDDLEDDWQPPYPDCGGRDSYCNECVHYKECNEADFDCPDDGNGDSVLCKDCKFKDYCSDYDDDEEDYSERCDTCPTNKKCEGECPVSDRCDMCPMTGDCEGETKVSSDTKEEYYEDRIRRESIEEFIDACERTKDISHLHSLILPHITIKPSRTQMRNEIISYIMSKLQQKEKSNDDNSGNEAKG